jgi:WD40 repeat protein
MKKLECLLAIAGVSLALEGQTLRADAIIQPVRVFGYGALDDMALSPDGNSFATAGSRGVFVWDAVTGSLLQTLDVYDGLQSEFERDWLAWNREVLFSPDGASLLTSSYGGTVVRIWDSVSGHKIRQFEGWHGVSLAFSRDGSKVLVAGGALDVGDRIVGSAAVRDVATGQKEREVETPFGCVAVAFSPDGSTFTAGGYLQHQPGDATTAGGAAIYNTSTGEIVRNLSGCRYGITAIDYSPEGSRVATAGGAFNHETEQYEGEVFVWSVSSGDRIAALQLEQCVRSLAFSPDGSTLIAGTSPDEGGGGSVLILNGSTGERLQSLKLHDSRIHSIAFAPDGQSIWTASDDRRVLHADLNGGALLLHDQHVANYSFWTVSFSPDRRRVCGQASLWDAETGEILLKLDNQHSEVVTFSPDGNRLLTANPWDPLVRLWNVADGTLVRTFEGHASGIWSVAFSPDGRRILTGSEDRTARVWDAETGELIWNFDEHPSRVASVAFSPDGTCALTGAGSLDWSDPIAHLWDLNTGALMRSFEGGFQCEFSRDGSQVRTGNGRGDVRAYEISSGNLIRSLSLPWGDFAFSPDDKLVLTFNFAPTSAGGDATLTDVMTGQRLLSLDWHGEWVRAAFWPGGHYVLTCGDDGVARLWDIRDLIARPRSVRSDSGPEIHWDLGTLQYSPTITGPWLDLPAASPFPLSPVGGQGYFRVKVEE